MLMMHFNTTLEFAFNPLLKHLRHFELFLCNIIILGLLSYGHGHKTASEALCYAFWCN